MGLGLLCKALSIKESWSGRPGSNRRRPAWEAGILPLNYSRFNCLLRSFDSRFTLAQDLGSGLTPAYRLDLGSWHSTTELLPP